MKKLKCPTWPIFYTTKMSDSFEAEMLDFCVRFLTKHGAQLSAEQLSTLSALFPNQLPILSNPFDPTSFTFHWTIAEEPPLSEYISPPVTAIVEAPPPPKRKCPYHYNGAWPSPTAVRIARKVIQQRYWCQGLQAVMKKYAKHGEKRLTHEIAINYLADTKGLTPEEFLKRVPLPPRGKKTYYGWTGHGDYCIAEW